MAFAIDIRWACGQNVSIDAVNRFNGAFRPADDSTCVWVEDDEPETLRVEFDVEATDFDAATRDAAREVQAAALQSDLEGEIQEVIAMTEEGHSRWAK